jgi:hypothetical protein
MIKWISVPWLRNVAVLMRPAESRAVYALLIAAVLHPTTARDANTRNGNGNKLLREMNIDELRRFVVPEEPPLANAPPFAASASTA